MNEEEQKKFDELLNEWGKGYYWAEEGWTTLHAELLPKANKEIKSFISNLLEERERDTYLRGYEKGCEVQMPLQYCDEEQIAHIMNSIKGNNK
jgi:hypothetical protein